MKRRTFLKNLGLVAAIPAVANLGCASTQAAARREEQKIRILTCNIRVDLPVDGVSGDSWAQRRDLCADVIGARKADLIGFQEMQMPHMEYLKSRLPEFDTFALYNPGKKGSPPNGIFFSRARFELLSGGGFWISETPHVAGSKSWDSANVRLVNWVHLRERKSGKELRFWNTHLDHISQPAREHGASMIVEACKPFPDDLPQFLTGDLNSGASNRAIQILKDGGWIDTYAAVHGPDEPGFTGHAFKGANAQATRANGTPKEKIDWVFCRGQVTPVDASIIRDSRNGHYPSDHFFVSADVKI